jgi:hypothetical protein
LLTLTVLWRILAFVLGTAIVARTLLSVVRTFVLPGTARRAPTDERWSLHCKRKERSTERPSDLCVE